MRGKVSLIWHQKNLYIVLWKIIGDNLCTPDKSIDLFHNQG